MNPTKSTALEAAKPGVVPAPLLKYLDAMAPSIGKVLPKHLTPARMIKLFSGLAASNPKIAACSLPSIAAVMVTCSQLGLEFGPLGHVYVIPRNIFDKTLDRKVMTLTMQIGYKGFFELARRSGKIKRAAAKVVYRREIELGLFVGSHEPPEITHQWRPEVLEHEDLNPINIVAAYCVVETTDGGRYQWLMDRHEIERRRLCNPAVAEDRASPWDTDYAAMAAKCPVRALFGSGVVPMSSEMAGALDADDDGSTGRSEVASEVVAPRFVDVEVVPEPAPAPPVQDPPETSETTLGPDGVHEEKRLRSMADAEGLEKQFNALRAEAGLPRDTQKWTASGAQKLEAAIVAKAGAR